MERNILIRKGARAFLGKGKRYGNTVINAKKEFTVEFQEKELGKSNLTNTSTEESTVFRRLGENIRVL